MGKHGASKDVFETRYANKSSLDSLGILSGTLSGCFLGKKQIALFSNNCTTALDLSFLGRFYLNAGIDILML